MSWLTLTIIAQALNSIVALLDKYLVTSKRVTTPLLYVFYTGVLTFIGALVYVPGIFFKDLGLPAIENIFVLPWEIYGIIVAASTFQLLALFAMFSSLKRADASDVVPVIGSFSAVYALILSFFLLDSTLSVNFLIGFALLVTGTLLISHFRFKLRTFLYTMLGGLFFALHSVFLKIAFHQIEIENHLLKNFAFDAGFFWFSTITTVLSLCLLGFSSIRKTFKSNRKESHASVTGWILLANKVVAGIAGILLIKAIDMGEVAIVQALGGLQFLFLFVLAIVLGPFTPIDFGENMKRKDVYAKLISISIIFIGFVLLFI